MGSDISGCPRHRQPLSVALRQKRAGGFRRKTGKTSSCQRLAGMGAPSIENTQRDQRRYGLARRLIGHQARTRTISRMTALSRHQLAALRRRWGVSEESRHRGPPPSSTETFTHSARARTEGALLAVYCRIHNLIPSREAAGGLLTLEFGERLCQAYEAYRACVPDSTVEFEELLSLVLGLARGDVISLSHCSECQATILIDRLSRRRHKCSSCVEQELAAAPESLARALVVADGQAVSPDSSQPELL